MKYDFIRQELFQDVIPVMKDNKWGVIDKQGKEILPLKFDSAPIHVKDGFVVEIAGKKGVLNESGQEIITVSYEDIHEIQSGIFRVKKEGDIKVVDTKNNLTFDANYEHITVKENGCYIVKNDKYYGLINSKGETVLNVEYDIIQLEGNFAIITSKRGKKCNLYDLENNEWIFKDNNTNILVLSPNCIAVQNSKGKWGFCDKNGEIRLGYQYDSIDFLKVAKVVKVYKKDKVGLINLEYKEIIPTEYDDIKWLKGNQLVLTLADKKRVVTTQGKELLPCIYDEISMQHDGYIYIKKQEKKGLLDAEYNVIIPPEYDDFQIVDGYVHVRNGWIKYGLYKLKTRKIICDLRYELISRFNEGLAVVKNQQGKFGYINELGDEVIPCIYSDANNFKNGYAFVCKNYKVGGYIDSKGQEVTRFIYRNGSSVGADGSAQVEIMFDDYSRLKGKIYLKE